MLSGHKKDTDFLLTGKDGIVVSIPMFNPEPGNYFSRYDWFFCNRALSPRIELPYVVVDLGALANYSFGS
jgi:hypothetical protein